MTSTETHVEITTAPVEAEMDERCCAAPEARSSSSAPAQQRSAVMTAGSARPRHRPSMSDHVRPFATCGGMLRTRFPRRAGHSAARGTRSSNLCRGRLRRVAVLAGLDTHAPDRCPMAVQPRADTNGSVRPGVRRRARALGCDAQDRNLSLEKRSVDFVRRAGIEFRGPACL